MPLNKRILGKDENAMNNLKKIATKGIVWVSLTSFIAAPFAYYRNWLLGQFGADGKVVGTYALVLLFVDVISTLVVFGGSSVVTNFMPKISEKRDKAAFLLSYIFLSIPTSFLFVLVLIWWPNLIHLITGQVIDAVTVKYILILIPVTVLSQVVIFALSGLMLFQSLSLLTLFQLMSVAIFATIAYFFFPAVLIENALSLLTLTVAGANSLVVLIGSVQIFKVLEFPKKLLFFPKGFWRFSLFVQGNTVCTFIELSLDKIFVLVSIGVDELGAYFVLLQCAELIRFIPTRLGQVLLATFSNLIGEGRNEELVSAYKKVCRLLLVMSTCCTLMLILLSHPIAGLFGTWAQSRHQFLIILSVALNIGSIVSVNCMLIMAKEKADLYFMNNIVMISFQLATSLLAIAPYGVYGVIEGKVVGIITGQIGLFMILAWRLPGIRLLPPFEYWVSQLFVICVALVAFSLNGIDLKIALISLLFLIPIYLLLVKFDPREVIRMIRSRNTRPDMVKV